MGDDANKTLSEPAAARASGRPPVSVQENAPVSVQPLELHRTLQPMEELGQGGMGAIIKSLDPHLGRHVAMKTLHAELGLDGDEANRFIAEAQVTGQLEHPNVVPVYSLSRGPDDRLFFTMKLVRGQTLAELLADMGPARLEMENLEKLIEIVIKVCDAIAFAHSRGVIHRDIKPDNLMIGGFGQVYVMDWGIAALSRSPHLASDAGKLLGTPAYMSPEQVKGRDVGERADVYGIGGLLYTILTAQTPHQGENLNALLYDMLTEGVVPPEERVPDLSLPPELCRIAKKALALHQDDRHRSVSALREDLVAFQRGGGWLETRAFATGDIVYREGDPAEEAFVILSGQCEAIHEEDGEREVLRRLAAGDIVGEVALLSGGNRTTTVVATCDTVTKVVTRASLGRELERNVWMRALFDGVSQRFRLLEKLLLETLRDDG